MLQQILKLTFINGTNVFMVVGYPVEYEGRNVNSSSNYNLILTDTRSNTKRDGRGRIYPLLHGDANRCRSHSPLCWRVLQCCTVLP